MRPAPPGLPTVGRGAEVSAHSSQYRFAGAAIAAICGSSVERQCDCCIRVKIVAVLRPIKPHAGRPIAYHVLTLVTGRDSRVGFVEDRDVVQREKLFEAPSLGLIGRVCSVGVVVGEVRARAVRRRGALTLVMLEYPVPA